MTQPGVGTSVAGFIQSRRMLVCARAHVQLPWFCANKSQRWIWMSSRGSGWTALWPHPENHGAHHRHIARNGVHRRPETVGKCCVSSSDRPAHHHLPLPLNHTPTTASPQDVRPTPRISDRCRMGTHGAALRPGGGVWPSCFPGLRYSPAGHSTHRSRSCHGADGLGCCGYLVGLCCCRAHTRRL